MAAAAPPGAGAAAMGGAGAAAAPPGGAPAMGAGAWVENTLSSLWGQVKIYARMAHTRITAPRRRDTLDEILAYTERAKYIPPLWLTELDISDKINKRLIDDAIVAGKRAHGAAYSVLRSYMIYLDAYNASLRGANASLRTDLRAATEQLFENILLYNVYTYFKYLNRINLRKLASSRGSGVSVKALASESQNVAIETSIWGESHVPFDAMPYELCQRLNAIVTMNPVLAANYLLEASPEAGEHTKPPKILGLPDVDESTEKDLGAAMEDAIVRAKDILSAIEKLWNNAAGMKEPSSADFSKALVSLVKANKTTSFGAGRISSAFDSIVGAGAIAGVVAGTGENYNSLAAVSGGGSSSAAMVAPAPAFSAVSGGAAGGSSLAAGAAEHAPVLFAPAAAPSSGTDAFRKAAAEAAAARNSARLGASARGAPSGGGGDASAASSSSSSGVGGKRGLYGGANARTLAMRAIARATELRAIANSAANAANAAVGGAGYNTAAKALETANQEAEAAEDEAISAAKTAGIAYVKQAKRARIGEEEEGQGGGARRTRRRRHHKTRRHAHKSKSRKAKTHHRSRASRRRQH